MLQRFKEHVSSFFSLSKQPIYLLVCYLLVHLYTNLFIYYIFYLYIIYLLAYEIFSLINFKMCGLSFVSRLE